MWAIVGTLPQGLLDHLPTPTTSLTRAPGLNCRDCLSSFFRFESQASNERAPGCIIHGLSESTVRHLLNLECFYADQVVLGTHSFREVPRVIETLVANLGISLAQKPLGFDASVTPPPLAL